MVDNANCGMQFLISDHLIPLVQLPVLDLNFLPDVLDAEGEDNASSEEGHNKEELLGR